MPPEKRSYELVIAGEDHFPIDWPVYTFRDARGMNAHLERCTPGETRCDARGLPWKPAKGLGKAPQRFRPRRSSERSVAAAQGLIRQVVVHLDGCLSATMCFDVLHNERGLSCHFLIDNDGTIYQTLDLADCAFHAAGLNETSIGIELCNRGDASPDPRVYERPGRIRRDLVTCTINGHDYLAFEYTKPQLEAMVVLGQALARYLPGIKLDYPQSSPGAQHWGTLSTDGSALAASYSGYLGHYHLTEQKWDPGPFDFRTHLGRLTGRRAFPVGLHGTARELPEAPPAGSPDRERYLGLFETYHRNEEAPGSSFPVGPLDDKLLWHGGIHLYAPRGTPVVAPVAGRIVLARNRGTALGIGSTSFVLLEHNLKVGPDTQLRFYTLLFHLGEETPGEDRPRWMASAAWRNAEPSGPLRPPEQVRAGEVVGHVGVAGPDSEAQLHWEIFTLEHRVVEALGPSGFWKVYAGTNDQRLCTNAEVARLERAGDPTWARGAVTHHYSEWSEEPSWEQAILEAAGADVSKRRRREIEEMVADQILPTIWWREDIAGILGLPTDAKVFHYHPVTFLRWLNDLVGARQAAQVASGKRGQAQLDIDDVEGSSMISEADLPAESPRPKPTLEELIDGYPE